jgi:hypothetical protein
MRPAVIPDRWMADGDQAGASFGHSVATAGDVNGDGFDDVIVGAYQYDHSQLDEGRAFAYEGSAHGLSTVLAWTADGGLMQAFFGYSLGTAGDVNGDGFDDVIVGAYSGNNNPGRAFVYQGSASGLPTSPGWIAVNDQVGSLFGLSVGTAGDVNGDGYADVIVGAPGFDSDEGDSGRAFLYEGSPSGLSSTPDWSSGLDEPNSFFAWSVATAGDVNGDGFDDVIVGANGVYFGDHAFVYLGSPSGLASTPAWSAGRDMGLSGFGGSVATAGDVNGDGFDDVIVGAPGSSGGSAFVYHGSASGLSSKPAWIDHVSGSFGYSVGTAGDVNSDGFDDVIIGALWYSDGQLEEGAAFVFAGSPRGLIGTHSFSRDEGNQETARLGVSVGSAGDVNGDGTTDTIVGADWYDHGETDEGAAFVTYRFGALQQRGQSR